MGEENLRPYLTAAGNSEREILIQRSRFIGRCFPVKTEKEALGVLADIRRRHWDASHNCYAYSIGPGGGCARYSDDGEPGGTAGLPMMEVLRRREVTDVLCVVTRYFGGILLGAGGLVRMAPGQIYAFTVPYGQWTLFQQIITRFGSLKDVEYADVIRCRVEIPREQGENMLLAVRDKTNDTLRGTLEGEQYLPFPVEV